MSAKQHPQPPAHGPAVPAPQSFNEAEDAKSTVAFAIGGTTVTAGGLLAWFAYGTALTAFGAGVLVAIGVLVMAGVVAALIIGSKGGL